MDLRRLLRVGRKDCLNLSKSEFKAEHKLLKELSNDIEKQIAGKDRYYWLGTADSFPTGASILKSDPMTIARFAIAIAELFAADKGQHEYYYYYNGIWGVYRGLFGSLLNKRPKFNVKELEYMLGLYSKFPNVKNCMGLSDLTKIALSAFERNPHDQTLLLIMQNLDRELSNLISKGYSIKETRVLLTRLQTALQGGDPHILPMDEAWQLAFLKLASPAVVNIAQQAKGIEPSKKWLTTAQTALASENEEAFLHAFEAAMLAIRKMDTRVDSIHSDMLRGICWMAGQIKTERSAYLLGEMLLACNHKLSGQGARSQKGFNACVVALEQFGEIYALAELSKARAKVKTPSLAEMLLNSLTSAAERQNIPLAELEELVVPTYDMEAPGLSNYHLGDAAAELRIIGTADVELTWKKAGNPVKSVPSIVKQEFKSEVLSISKRKREIESSLSAQKQRLESLFMVDRVWPFPLWRVRHIDHPLLAQMTRRLIWTFSTKRGDVLGICPNGTPVDIESKPIEGLDDGTLVKLWHPLDAGVSAVEAWREFLFAHEIAQPFKQAHREVYLLTDAERRTGIYSNRFAAHVLKQHQASALMRTRGWRYSLQGYFDAYNTPTLTLPALGLDAQYFLEVAPDPGDQDMSESGIALYVISDQVRFVRSNGGEVVDLEEIPAKILSEVFRDVDLFVGVSSVGNDPNWLDQGARPQYNEYWQKAAFGELSATAQTRKEILGRLIPRLSIANVSHLDGKFLVVKGRIRTYKIHLGSSNILMMPNDQYLCIVPGGGRSDDHSHVFLPFEGDRTMAVILSKALMLAQDDKIKDPTIISQLKR